jgi:hypothetical protein
MDKKQAKIMFDCVRDYFIYSKGASPKEALELASDFMEELKEEVSK